MKLGCPVYLLLVTVVLVAAAGCQVPTTPIPSPTVVHILAKLATVTPFPTVRRPTSTLLPSATTRPTSTPLPTETPTDAPLPTATATRVPPTPAAAPIHPPVSTIRRTLTLPGGDPPSLDPAIASDATSRPYIVEIYSGLVKLDRNMRVKPDIAERWDVSPDGKTYTFYLRKDVKYQDGRAATARDFKYSIERAADPATKSPTAATYLGDIVGIREKLAGNAMSVSGVRVLDDYTVEITIAAPRSYFLAKLTYPVSYLVDQRNVVHGGISWSNNPNGTGPFKLLEYRRGQRLVLGANDLFYDGVPYVSRVQFILSSYSLSDYENGRLDVAGVGSSAISRVTRPDDPLNQELSIVPQLSTQFVVFNTQKPPFDDPRVRQAFALAIDRAQLVKVAYGGIPMAANSILPPGMPGYSNPAAPAYDPALAKQLLGRSKYADNMPDIVWNISASGGPISPAIQAMVEMLTTNLGVTISVQQTEWSAFLTMTHDPQRGGMQMYSMEWSADYVDPENYVDILFRTGSDSNFSLYSNSAVDKLLDQAAQEKDSDIRIRLYQQAERMIMADYPIIPLTHGRSFILTKPYVEELVNSPITTSRLRYVWLSD